MKYVSLILFKLKYSNGNLGSDFKICNIDMGIGILKLKENYKYKKMPELEKMNFVDFLKFYKQLKLINSEEALDFI